MWVEVFREASWERYLETNEQHEQSLVRGRRGKGLLRKGTIAQHRYQKRHESGLGKVLRMAGSESSDLLASGR